MSQIKDLYEFIELAQRNRKYPANTASGFKAALKLFESDLTDDEMGSIDLFLKNIDQIYQSVARKNPKNMSMDSLRVYKDRVTRLIRDYQSYGVDPTKIANWNRPVRAISRTKKVREVAQIEVPGQSEPDSILRADNQGSRVEIPLRDDFKALVYIPGDISKTEVEKINKILTAYIVEV